MQFEPELFKFEVTSEHKKDGKNKKSHDKTTISFDTEDIIAFFAGLAALIMTIGMVAGWIEVNKLTVSIASLSGVSAALAKIIGARLGKSAKAKAEPRKPHHDNNNKKP